MNISALYLKDTDGIKSVRLKGLIFSFSEALHPVPSHQEWLLALY